MERRTWQAQSMGLQELDATQWLRHHQIAFHCMSVCPLTCAVLCSVFSHVWLSVTPWTVARQTPLSRGFSSRWILYHLSHQGSPRILKWVAYPFSRGSSPSRNRTGVSCITGGLFYQLSYQGSPYTCISSVQFSCSVVSDTLQPHGLQHARLHCPSATLRVYSNSRPSSQWCHPTISSSVAPFLYLQSFPASGYFPMSQLFTSGGQSIGVQL